MALPDPIGVSPEDIAAGTAGAVVGIGSLWLLVKRWAVQSATDGTAVKAAHAQSDVIQLLRDEVQRMSAVNNRLYDALTAANGKIDQLSAINLQLGEALANAKREVTELQAQILGMREDMDGMTDVMRTIAMRKSDKFSLFDEERRTARYQHAEIDS